MSFFKVYVLLAASIQKKIILKSLRHLNFKVSKLKNVVLLKYVFS